MMSVTPSSASKRLERPEAQHVVQEYRDEITLLLEIEIDLFGNEKLTDDFADLFREFLARKLGGGGRVDMLHQARLNTFLRRLDRRCFLIDFARAGPVEQRIAVGDAGGADGVVEQNRNDVPQFGVVQLDGLFGADLSGERFQFLGKFAARKRADPFSSDNVLDIGADEFRGRINPVGIGRKRLLGGRRPAGEKLLNQFARVAATDLGP